MFEDPLEGVPWPDEAEGWQEPAESTLDAAGRSDRTDPITDPLDVVAWESPGVLDVAATLARLLEHPPGPASLQLVAALHSARVSDEARSLLLTAVARHVAWLTAWQAELVVDVAERVGPALGQDVTELRLALAESEAMAELLLSSGRLLAGDLPRLHAAMRAGQLGPRHVRAVAEVVEEFRERVGGLPEPLDDSRWAAAMDELEERLLAQGPDRTPPQMRVHARRLLNRALPDVPRQQMRTQVRQRRVSEYADGQHAVGQAVTLTPLDGVMVRGLVDQLASHPGLPLPPGAIHAGAGLERRTAEQARADAVVFALLHTADCPHADAQLEAGVPVADRPTPDPRVRRRPRVGVRVPRLEIGVLVDLPTLLGLADHPGELLGYGQLPAEVVRSLALHHPWRRLVTDPVTGHLLDYGRRVYRPPTALRDYLLARDRTCRVPGCQRRASLQLDHDPPWSQGGVTSAASMAALCTHEHQQKTEGHLRLRHQRDGTVMVTTKTGRQYPSPPPPQRRE